jgi:hypothetical protein
LGIKKTCFSSACLVCLGATWVGNCGAETGIPGGAASGHSCRPGGGAREKAPLGLPEGLETDPLGAGGPLPVSHVLFTEDACTTNSSSHTMEKIPKHPKHQTNHRNTKQNKQASPSTTLPVTPGDRPKRPRPGNTRHRTRKTQHAPLSPSSNQQQQQLLTRTRTHTQRPPKTEAQRAHLLRQGEKESRKPALFQFIDKATGVRVTRLPPPPPPPPEPPPAQPSAPTEAKFPPCCLLDRVGGLTLTASGNRLARQLAASRPTAAQKPVP